MKPIVMKPKPTKPTPQLAVLPDTPNTRRLAQICHQIWLRKQQTAQAA